MISRTKLNNKKWPKASIGKVMGGKKEYVIA